MWIVAQAIKTHVTLKIQGESQLEMKPGPGFRLEHVDPELSAGAHCLITHSFQI